MPIKEIKRNFKKFIHCPKPFRDHWYFLVYFIIIFLSADAFLSFFLIKFSYNTVYLVLQDSLGGGGEESPQSPLALLEKYLKIICPQLL